MSDWIFELKCDGFRSLAYIDNGRCSSKAQRLPQALGL
jgi:ATP-dependent DNA ligase